MKMHPETRKLLDEARDIGAAIARTIERVHVAAERGNNAEAMRLAMSAVQMVGRRDHVIATIFRNIGGEMAYRQKRADPYDKSLKTAAKLRENVRDQAELVCELVYVLGEQ